MMKKIINEHIFHFPPYLSTNWTNVASMHVANEHLVITLINGEPVSIPNIEKDTLETIFDTHQMRLTKKSQKKEEDSSQSHFRFGLGNLDQFSTAMQHNPNQANAPDIPSEILEKLQAICRIISPEDLEAVPKPQPQCNCPHCQIARAIHEHISPEKQEEVEEDVSEEDLSFRQWDIYQTGEKMYEVISRLDPKEKYSVYLGNPVGCTCGQSGCEHIIAVLNS